MAGEALRGRGALVFVEESGLHTSTMRLRARAPRERRGHAAQGPAQPGQEEHDAADGEHLTPEEGMGPCAAVEGSTTAEVFEAYVEQVLAAAPKEGKVVVMDGLAAHKTERVRRLVE